MAECLDAPPTDRAAVYVLLFEAARDTGTLGDLAPLVRRLLLSSLVPASLAALASMIRSRPAAEFLRRLSRS